MYRRHGPRVAEDDGSPEGHRGLLLAIGLGVTTSAVVAAFLIGRSVSTPAEQAARARPPQPSILTAPVRRAALGTVVLRGTLVDPTTLIAPPTDLGGDLPEITAVAVRRGQVVESGSVVAAVAGRPIFVMAGQLAAYRTMSYGDSGVDVAELQTDLQALGLPTSPDGRGYFGSGTSAALSALYHRAGYAPVTTARATLRIQGRRRRVVIRRYASVPLGEIRFVRRLPAQVVTAPVLGKMVAAHGSVARLGSGRAEFRVRTDTNTASLLRVGTTGRAISNLSNGSFPIVLTSERVADGSGTPDRTLTLTPLRGSVAARYLGQNMELKLAIRDGTGSQLLVPVSAVVTNAAGKSTVTVVKGSRESEVAVEAGVAFGGSEVVRPLHGRLAVGDDVVVGIAGGG